MEFFKWQDCAVAWQSTDKDPLAATELLAELYRRETGETMPPICRTDLGKPYFAGSALRISVSHTDRHVFCCISRQNVGIDAEEIDRRAKPVYLSAAEQARLAVSKDPQKDFLRLWVLKESYAKLTGKGIGSYLKETDFFPDDPRITEIDGCFVAVMTQEDNTYAF